MKRKHTFMQMIKLSVYCAVLIFPFAFQPAVADAGDLGTIKPGKLVVAFNGDMPAFRMGN